MIDNTKVPDAQRRAFLGKLGAAMLSAVVAGCTPPTAEITGIRPKDDTETRVIEVEKGIRPDLPKHTPTPEDTSTPTPDDTPTPPPAVTGIRPEQEEKPSTPVVRGIRPDQP
jgi:hypothetical protein